jgi:hypothetical protein
MVPNSSVQKLPQKHREFARDRDRTAVDHISAYRDELRLRLIIRLLFHHKYHLSCDNFYEGVCSLYAIIPPTKQKRTCSEAVHTFDIGAS